jgi:chromosome segregation ATPase
VNELRTSATTNEAEKNNRIKELEKKQSEIEQEFRKNQQTIYKHLKDCATILFNSNNSCDNPSNLSLAYLEEEAEKVKQGCRESKNHNQELANQNHDLTTQLIAREKNVQSLQEQL